MEIDFRSAEVDMLARHSFATRALRGATLLWLQGCGLLGLAATPANTELQSASWWREQAAQFCETIDDPTARSDAFYKLAYESGHANDLTAAASQAANVSRPQKGIYALTFVAKQFHEHGDDHGAESALRTARHVAESSQSKLTNFAPAALIPAMVDLGMVDDAREYVAAIDDRVQREIAARNLLAALATHDLLDTQKTKLAEADWAEIAYAYAGKGRIDDTQSALKYLTTETGRDRIYVALVDALVTSKRWAEAEPFIEQIASPHTKAQSQEKFLHAWARGQSVDAINARLEKASSRAEKVALNEELIANLKAGDGVDEIEIAIKAAINAIQDSPQPVFVSKFGQFDDALEIAKEKSNYVITAKILSRQGKPAAAKERLRWAEESVRELPPPAGPGTMMVALGIVGGKIELGDLTGARRSIQDASPPFRGMLAAQVAKAYAKAGATATSIEVAREIDSDRKARGTLYGEVAGELTRRGDAAAMQKLLAGLDGTGEDAEAYYAVGKAMLEAGKSDELHQWLADMPYSIDKAFACIGAAEALRKSGSP